MTTIEEVKNLITGFKIDPNEMYHYLNKGPGHIAYVHIAYVSFKAKEFATALEIYNYMVANKVDKIEDPYYISPMIDKEIIMTDYADTIKGKPYLYQHTYYPFVVLDKRSPLYMTKVNIGMHLLLHSTDQVEVIFSNMDNIGLPFFFSLYADRNEEGKFGSYDTAIRRFIEDTIKDTEGVLNRPAF